MELGRGAHRSQPLALHLELVTIQMPYSPRDAITTSKECPGLPSPSLVGSFNVN